MIPSYGMCFQCLLVQGFWSKANWGFPKGKVNEDEVSHDCAIREVSRAELHYNHSVLRCIPDEN